MKFLPGVVPVIAVIAGVVFMCRAGGPGVAEESVGRADASALQVYAGMPAATRPESEFVFIDNSGFDIGYSEYRQDPVWVGYRIKGERLPGSLKRPQTFKTDARTSARVSHRDYSRTGYDRGHMAPNHAIATRYGREAQLETFRMSNIVPQKPALNRQVWRRLEELEADRYSVSLDGVWVITGPIFDDDRQFLKKGQPRIDIPDAFFKVIVDEVAVDESGAPGTRVLAFIVPQDVAGDEPLGEFLVSVDWIEEKAGLDLMPDLADDVETTIESGVADALW